VRVKHVGNRLQTIEGVDLRPLPNSSRRPLEPAGQRPLKTLLPDGATESVRQYRLGFDGRPGGRAAIAQRAHGPIVSFELKGAAQPDVFRFMDALKMIVRTTSLGDVHTMMLYPVMSSHREIFSQAPRAHGHSREPGAIAGGDRGGGGYRWGFAAGAGGRPPVRARRR
jgi:Cys/Met metabolism PLP-dependent enzyme